MHLNASVDTVAPPVGRNGRAADIGRRGLLRGDVAALRGLALAAAALLLAHGWFAGPALAQARDGLFTVADVAVDVTANTATEARERALAEGQTQALAAMLRRLTRAADWQRLPPVGPDEVTDFVRDFEIVDEQISDVRYMATLTVRFHADAVGQFLQRTGVPYTDTPSLPVLVVPLLRQGPSVLLWEESNGWREAWSETGRASGLVPLHVPFGDISDIGALSAAEALRVEPGPLRALADKYGARDSLVALATLIDGDAGGRPRVEVSLTRVGDDPQAPISFIMTAGPGQSAATLMQLAVETAVDRLEDAWISAHAVAVGPQQTLCLEARFASMAGWVAINERLGQLGAVLRTRLKSLSPGRAEVEIAFSGALPQLAAAMAQVGLTLSPPEQRGFSRFAARPVEPEGLHVLTLAGGR